MKARDIVIHQDTGSRGTLVRFVRDTMWVVLWENSIVCEATEESFYQIPDPEDFDVYIGAPVIEVDSGLVGTIEDYNEDEGLWDVLINGTSWRMKSHQLEVLLINEPIDEGEPEELPITVADKYAYYNQYKIELR